MKAAVVVFPGTNRDGDVTRALTQAGISVVKVWHTDHTLPAGTDLVVLPGGFSYGDYLRCGAIAARAPIMAAIRVHAQAGGLVLGICNGFQVLCEAGFLPGVLMRNAGLKFICRRQIVRVTRNDTAFTHLYNQGQLIDVAIAHGEGNYTVDPSTLERLEGEGRIAFRYADSAGDTTQAANPNGSMNNIAGLYCEKFKVLGLMPHPENLIDDLTGGTDGRGLFASLMAA